MQHSLDGRPVREDVSPIAAIAYDARHDRTFFSLLQIVAFRCIGSVRAATPEVETFEL